MSFSERVYRILLVAYPRRYRRVYAEPMQQLFCDRLHEVHSFAQLSVLWVRTLSDWAVSVVVQHWEGSAPDLRAHLASADAARRCIFFAREEASSFSRNEISLEHLLLGVLRQEPSIARDADAVVRAIEADQQSGRRVPPMEDLRLSRETVRVWEGAREIARVAGGRWRLEIW